MCFNQNDLSDTIYMDEQPYLLPVNPYGGPPASPPHLLMELERKSLNSRNMAYEKIMAERDELAKRLMSDEFLVAGDGQPPEEGPKPKGDAK